MAFRVLVVDDSSFFCRRVREILNRDPMLEVVGEARNGKDAINMVAELRPDVVTMDVEMPVMDGITAVKQIMTLHPVPILMFSSLTSEGAQATLDALEAGALDFIPKKFEDIARNRKDAIELLQSRVKALASKPISFHRARPSGSGRSNTARAFSSSIDTRVPETGSQLPRPLVRDSSYSSALTSSNKAYKILAIGTSTGGPVALQKILTHLPANFPYPILLVQHMPGSFTKAFAERLNDSCNISVKEAQNGDRLRPGHAYLAPGGLQMLVEGTPRDGFIKIVESPTDGILTYKPSVDITFASISRVYNGDVLGIILTGMGADGREGCRSLHAKGAKIWAQDESTSIVYGMPQAVTQADIAEKNIPLDNIAQSILTEMQVK